MTAPVFAPFTVPPSGPLLLAVDTLVEAVHFFADIAPADLGYKALAVNLSDLAAMGGTPHSAYLVIADPQQDRRWCDAVMDGARDIAAAHAMPMPEYLLETAPRRQITVQIQGTTVQPPLRRGGATAGDAIYVTGSLGDAALALAEMKSIATIPCQREQVRSRYFRPTPRVYAGQALAAIASSCIDISDGLVSDLGHILTASGLAAEIAITRLPLSAALQQLGDQRLAATLALSGGDDYELCFTVPAARQAAFTEQQRALGCTVTRIGHTHAGNGLRVIDRDGSEFAAPPGFEHFRS